MPLGTARVSINGWTHGDGEQAGSSRRESTYKSALARRVDVLVYSVGDRVSQGQYGTGTVTVANDHHTVIEFDEHGSRTFATRLVQLERSATAAPAKIARPRRRAAKRPHAG